MSCVFFSIMSCVHHFSLVGSTWIKTALSFRFKDNSASHVGASTTTSRRDTGVPEPDILPCGDVEGRFNFNCSLVHTQKSPPLPNHPSSSSKCETLLRIEADEDCYVRVTEPALSTGEVLLVSGFTFSRRKTLLPLPLPSLRGSTPSQSHEVTDEKVEVNFSSVNLSFEPSVLLWIAEVSGPMPPSISQPDLTTSPIHRYSSPVPSPVTSESLPPQLNPSSTCSIAVESLRVDYFDSPHHHDDHIMHPSTSALPLHYLISSKSLAVNIEPFYLKPFSKSLTVKSSRAIMELTFTPISLPVVPPAIPISTAIPPPCSSEDKGTTHISTSDRVTFRAVGNGVTVSGIVSLAFLFDDRPSASLAMCHPLTPSPHISLPVDPAIEKSRPCNCAQ